MCLAIPGQVMEIQELEGVNASRPMTAALRSGR